ncbi:azobenzene reductase [Bradyrhizobium diazoefficiens]
MEMPEPIRVLLMCGSRRSPSHTFALVTSIASKLEELGAINDVWNPRSSPLPNADPNYHRNPADSPDRTTQSLVQLANRADAIVLASPVYHNSYSGVLKDALDALSIPQFRYKAVGLASHGNRSSQPVDHLRIVVRGLLGVAIPTQICTTDSDYNFERSSFSVTDQSILERLDRFCAELILLASALRAIRLSSL